MRSFSAWLTSGAISLMLVIALPLAIVQDSVKYLNVSFSLGFPITLHEPVAMDVLIENQRSDTITSDLGLDSQTAFRITIIGPDGKQTELPLGVKEGISIGGRHSLKAKAKYYEVLVLDEWYAFDHEGNYRIQVALDTPVKIGEPETRFALTLDTSDHQKEEEVFDLTILPRNEAALKERCDNLLRYVQEGHVTDQSKSLRGFYAANQMSYIKDPIAIPYIAKLAENMEEVFAINGLRRIGTDEAWEAMIEVTKSKHDPSAGEVAKYYLRDQLPKIRNPEIRRKIEAVVKSLPNSQ